MNIHNQLPKPFFVLAPMFDVTDTVFRRVIAECAPPDLFFTEFTNVDGLQSEGRKNLLKYLQFTPQEKPIIAQIWGKDPENYYKTARQLADGTLADEARWYARRSGSDKVQGYKEKRASRTGGTVSESQTQLTQQFAESTGRVLSFAQKQASAASVSGGFDGIDINMGCPDKNIIKNGCCAALINDRELAAEIIQATQEGAGSLPVSVKTRLGFNEIDLTWHEFLLNQKLDALTIHGRTKKEMSKVPPHWDAVTQIVKLRDKLSPATKIIGNGDVMTRAEGEELAKKYNLDGVMMGRAVFTDPFVFAKKSPWPNYTKEQRLDLYRRHVELFAQAWPNGERKVHTLNTFCKIYINGFDGAKELREQLMNAQSTSEILKLLNSA